MRVLVTGSNGFTGRYLAENFKQNGLEVYCLKSDLRDKDSVASEVRDVQPGGVVNLASIASVEHFNTNAFYEVNLIGTKNLLDALLQHAPHVQSILLVSSANVYGNINARELSESMVPDPINDYGVSKLAMENMAKLKYGVLPIFITRPFNYTGPGQSVEFIIPKIIHHFRNFVSSIELGNINVYREFGDVRDVVDIYRHLLSLKPLHQTINVCTGEAYSLEDVISICSEITNHQIHVEANEDFVRENEVTYLCGDRTVLDSIIGHQKPRSIRETIEYMLQE